MDNIDISKNLNISTISISQYLNKNYNIILQYNIIIIYIYYNNIKPII